ncbi:CerR family C-terminal domain-containing protein [Bauldia sp.]|uniref:CerR family C-terminal domain-containing protein n=1 Tax=Bauldia sp. TaxID=2575872 RepID=UPI003BAA4B0F
MASGQPNKPGRRVGSRHHQQAQRDRGAETRQRLIAAALDVFGRYGFEGATTRQIAKAANANLAAIVYHFGSKEALHLAVAEYIGQRMGEMIGPTLASAATAEALVSPETARAALFRIMGTYIDMILGADEAEQFARFIVREQMQPSAAFDVIFTFVGGAHALACRLVARIIGGEETDDAVKVRVFTLVGQILVFRVAQAVVLRTTGWASIGEAERDMIRDMILSNADAILDREMER